MNCEVCGGTRGGVPGNENVIDGILTVCDYCHADMIQEEEFLNMTLRQGKYIGPNAEDKDMSALIKVFSDYVMVQFDDIEHPKGHFWHRYESNEWELFPEPNE